MATTGIADQGAILHTSAVPTALVQRIEANETLARCIHTLIWESRVVWDTAAKHVPETVLGNTVRKNAITFISGTSCLCRRRKLNRHPKFLGNPFFELTKGGAEWDACAVVEEICFTDIIDCVGVLGSNDTNQNAVICGGFDALSFCRIGIGRTRQGLAVSCSTRGFTLSLSWRFKFVD